MHCTWSPSQPPAADEMLHQALVTLKPNGSLDTGSTPKAARLLCRHATALGRSTAPCSRLASPAWRRRRSYKPPFKPAPSTSASSTTSPPAHRPDPPGGSSTAPPSPSLCESSPQPATPPPRRPQLRWHSSNPVLDLQATNHPLLHFAHRSILPQPDWFPSTRADILATGCPERALPPSSREPRQLAGRVRAAAQGLCGRSGPPTASTCQWVALSSGPTRVAAPQERCAVATHAHRQL